LVSPTLEKIVELSWMKSNQISSSSDTAQSDYHLFRSMDNLSLIKLSWSWAGQGGARGLLQSKPTKFYTDWISSMREKWMKVIKNYGKSV
jgi:hypothetical protein